jgi:hypothetical protein
VPGHGAPVENPSRETIFVVSREGFLFYKYKKLTCFVSANDDIKITKYELNVTYSQKGFITWEFIRHNRYTTFANTPNLIAKQIGGKPIRVCVRSGHANT